MCPVSGRAAGNERGWQAVASPAERIVLYVAAAAVVVAGFVAAYQFVEPAPPRRVAMAAGAVDGAYWRFAQSYRAELARAGIELDVKVTAGSVENLDLLRDPASGVDIALIQGGVATAEDGRSLVGLGSLFVEPLWIFTKLAPPPERLDLMRGRRIGVGVERSGTRVLAEQLLAASGVTAANAELRTLGGERALAALLQGDLDVSLQVAAASAPVLDHLGEEPGLDLVSLERAEAYAQVYPYLEHVVLHEGALDFAAGVPHRDTDLLAVKGGMVVRNDLHPAIVDMLMVILRQVHANGDIFSPPGQFPSPHGLEVPLAPEALRYYERGPPLLLRHLPFWAATLIDRAAILLVPVLTLLLPMLRIVPALLDWRLKSRVWRCYAELAAIERKALGGDVGAAREELERVEREVGELRLPRSHAHHVYQLRHHLDLVRQRLRAGMVSPSPAARP